MILHEVWRHQTVADLEFIYNPVVGHFLFRVKSQAISSL